MTEKCHVCNRNADTICDGCWRPVCHDCSEDIWGGTRCSQCRAENEAESSSASFFYVKCEACLKEEEG
jgi:hypothetical protein